MRSELVKRLIETKSGRVGGDFEQNASGLAKIDRMKIGPIDHWRHVKVQTHEMLAPLKLLCLISRSKRNVVNRAGRDISASFPRQAKQIDKIAGRCFIGRSKPKSIALFLDQTVPETICQQ